ncbi:MAG: HD domain-containing protein [Syntrophobacterales bacterium]|nr:HD domain-containing protein [Syntrophobacterales bacterium]
MTQLEIIACEYATHHHAAIGQVRKYTGEPYIKHPAAVVKIVQSVPHTPEMLAAAWLHDTVEDTAATLEEIDQLFGQEVACMVEMLTDVSRPSNGNRKVRKAIDLAHTANASPEAKTIKLADMIDNKHNIVERNPKFAKVYLVEKTALLEVLTEGDATLYAQAVELTHTHTHMHIHICD